MSLLIWIGIGGVIGYAATQARAEWDERRPRTYVLIAIAGALAGGLLASAGGLGSITALIAPNTWPAAALFAVLAVTIYQSAQ